MLKYKTKDVIETQKIGHYLGDLLKPGDVVSLEGDLGAGKTTFVQGICQGLGVAEPVTSPTFAIMHHYDGKYPVHHIDAYRIENDLELQELGLEEYLDGEGVSLVEWAENISSVMPLVYLQVQITTSPTNPQARTIIFSPKGSKDNYDKLLKELAKACGSWA